MFENKNKNDNFIQRPGYTRISGPMGTGMEGNYAHGFHGADIR
jgi:hypothetical protein